MPAPQTLAELEADVARDLDADGASPRALAGAEDQRRDAGAGLPGDRRRAMRPGRGACAATRPGDNILVVDRAPPGREGPWVTYARMRNLRSPKNQIGPDLKLPALTYQAWHEAQWGAAHFAAMTWIPKEGWQDYLGWFRRVTGIPVRNGVTAGAISPARTDDDLPCLASRPATGRYWRGRW